MKIRRLAVKEIQPDVARVHYGHHADKPFFGELIEAITAGPVVIGVLEGPGAVAHVRNLIGATDPLESGARDDPRRFRGAKPLQHGSRLG